MENQLPKPELLAPAGSPECITAAVENGADAVYFGLNQGFNARARAANFSIPDLPALMHQLHQRNVRGYVTFNTLVFPDELANAESLIIELAEAGVDALLIQDIGVARLAREICPALPLHASTQMTMTSAETIALAEDLELERVVLARELSIEEISDIRRKTEMPLEVFVHGALCVAYSGQCLTSESLGGRSANRGQCAQACRLPYDLVADGEEVDLGDQKYLLSPQDLAAYDLTTQLIEAGVCSFKIEGRLKTPEYVANITRHYRQAIDDAMKQTSIPMSAQQRYEMEMSFSRGFSPGWLQGCDHKMLVPATSSAKRGVLAGTVVTVSGFHVTVDLECAVRAGDGIVFDGDRLQQEEQGGRVYGVWKHGQKVSSGIVGEQVSLTFAPEAIDVARIGPGIRLWKTDDPQLNQSLRKTFDGPDPRRRVPLDLSVMCKVGEPLVVQGTAENGATCDVRSETAVAEARKHSIDNQTLRDQLGRLGGTVYELRALDVQIVGNPMVPFSVLGKLRRLLIQQLESADFIPDRRNASVSGSSAITLRQQLQRLQAANSPTKEATSPTLHLLCRTLEQVQVAAEQGISNLYAEFQDIREYGSAVALAHSHNAKIFLATPRIQKPGEQGIFIALAKHQADGYLSATTLDFDSFFNAGCLSWQISRSTSTIL